MGRTLEEMGEERKAFVKALDELDVQIVKVIRREFKRGASLRSLGRAVGVSHLTIKKWMKL